jgi:Cu2+-exporting ATPase
VKPIVGAACAHCAAPIEEPGFCCSGCEMAASIIRGAGLERYYRDRTAPGVRPEPVRAAWSEVPVEAETDGSCTVRLHVGGLTCAACAWVTERAVLALPGVTEARVSPTSGRARVRWNPAEIDLDAICGRIGALGYRPRPVAHAAAPDRDLLLRLGVAAFCAMNVMLLSAGLYAGWFAGMAERDAALLRWASLAISTPAALWSAAPLIQGAWAALRHRLLSVDLPLAVGIVAMYVHGVVATLLGREAWLDSMTMLIALLLGGRVLEQGGRRRAVEAAQSLAGFAPATARRLTATGQESVPASQLAVGDPVMVGLGEQVPADGLVTAGAGRMEMAMLTGESEPVTLGVGDRVVAGGVVADGSFELRITATGEDTLVARMAAELAAAADRPSAPVLADRIAPAFTLATLVFAALAAALNGGEAGVAVLVVACPCALALAAPLTTAAGLGACARRGLLVRSGDALRRLADVDLVVFDKTGTLTGGHPEVVEADPAALRLAAALGRHSAHPVSRALVAACTARGIPLPTAHGVRELPGEGLEGVVDGKPVRFIRGVVEGVGEVHLRDALRPDAARVVASLGERVALLSGDRAEVAHAIAREAGVPDVVAPATPEAKAAWIRARQAEGRVVLFVGDGVNDGAALAAADVGIAMGGGAASSVLVADAILVGEGLAPVAAALRIARSARTAMHHGVVRAGLYNAVAVAVAVVGWMNPLLAALAMPISSAVAVWGARRVEAA